MINKIQPFNIKNTGKEKIIIIVLILCVCYLPSQAQEMDNYLQKELTAKVGAICMETSNYDLCASSEIYLTFLFDKEQVQVYEKEISTCGKESIYNIGTYNWEFLQNQKISIDFIAEQTEGTYAKNIALELRAKQLIGRITHLNGRVLEYVFKEVK